jgi:S-formylglutathione hydrolase FrmB
VIRYILIFFPLLFFVAACAQKHSLKKEILSSDLLETHVDYYMYESNPGTKDSVQLLYFFHGFGSSPDIILETGFIDSLQLFIERNSLENIVAVIPDGFKSYYIDNYDSSFQWQSMFNKELKPKITDKLKVKQSYIAGISMGGFGALNNFLSQPEKYDGIFTISAALRTDSAFLNLKPSLYKQLFGNIFGEEHLLSEHWLLHSPLHKLNAIDSQILQNKSISLFCGENDYLLEGNRAFERILKNKSIPFSLEISEGEHNNKYFRTQFVPGFESIFLETTSE